LHHRKTNNGNGAVAINPFGTKTMKRLSLEELKAQKAEQVTQNLENIKGGDVDWCHVWTNFQNNFDRNMKQWADRGFNL
jgi:hypothetical protein